MRSQSTICCLFNETTNVNEVLAEGEGDLKLCWLPTKLTGGCGWRGYEREEKEGEREVD